MEQSETTGLPEVAKLPKSTVTTKMCTVFSRGGVRTVELEKLKRFQQQLYFFERIQRTKYSSAEILPVAKMLHLCVIVRGSLIVYPFGFHSQTQPVTIFRDAGCVFLYARSAGKDSPQLGMRGGADGVEMECWQIPLSKLSSDVAKIIRGK